MALGSLIRATGSQYRRPSRSPVGAIVGVAVALLAGAAVSLAQSALVGAAMITAVLGLLAFLVLCGSLNPTQRDRQDLLGSLGFVLLCAAVPLLTLNALRISHSMSIGDALLVLGGLLVVVRRVRGVPAGWMPAWLPMAAAGVLIAGLLAAFRGNVRQDLVPAVEFAGTMIGLPLVLMLAVDSARRIDFLVEAWLCAVSLNAVLAVLDLKLGLGIGRRLTGIDYVFFTQRAAGLTLQPNHLALVSAMAMPVAALRASQRVRPGAFAVANARNLLYLFTLGGGVLASGSRAGLAAAAAGLVVLPMMQPGRRRSLGLLVLGMVIVAALAALTFDTSLASKLGIVTGQRFTGQAAGTQFSNDYRTHAYSAALRAVVADPLVGQGFQGARTAHDIYLQLLQVGGVIALAAFLAFISGLLGTARQLAASANLPWSLAGLSSAVGASLVVWLVAGLAQNELYDRYLYIPAGLLLALRLMMQEDINGGLSPRPSVPETLPMVPV